MNKKITQRSESRLHLGCDFTNDSPEKITADTNEIKSQLEQHKSGKVVLSDVEMKNIEHSLDDIQLRKHMLKARHQHELDKFNGNVEITSLSKAANCRNLSLHLRENTKQGIKECLLSQFSAVHKMMMQFSGRASYANEEYQNLDIAHKYFNLALKGSKACANIACTLDKLENGGKQNIEVKHQYVQVNEGGKAVIGSKIVPEGGANHEK